MNTIDDLRATLAGHAELHDDGLTDRLRAVDGRVRTVRRRRAAVAGGTAAVVLAGVAGGVAILNRPDGGNDNLLVGAPVPATIIATGYTFDFVDGVESEAGEHTLRIRLPGSDEPRLVSWATEGESQRVEVEAKWSAGFVSGQDDFEDFVWIPQGSASWVEVTADSRVALATYELGDEPPAGYTKDGVTFRQQAEGMELVAAVVADRGDTSVDLTFTVPDARLYITDVCQVTDYDRRGTGPWMNLDFDDDGGIGSGCGPLDDGWSDGGDGSAWFPDRAQFRPGDEATITATITDGHRDLGRIEDPDALLGLAVYALPDGTRTVAGNRVSPVVEYDGHTWALTSVEEAVLPADSWSVPAPASDERVLVGLAHRGIGEETIVIEVDGKSWGSIRGMSSGSGVDGVLPQDAEEVGFRTDAASGQAALLFYELVD